MNDPEAEVGGYYDGYRVPARKHSNHRRRRATAEGTWRNAASVMFFSFLVVFVFLLAMKITTNDLLQLNSSSKSLTSRKSSKDKSISSNPRSATKFDKKTATSSSSKPNFVFILADDVGFGSINSEDFPFTPFLSSLASDGITMDNYYSQELCAPARAALLTGRYPVRLGMQYGQLLPTQEGGLSITETLLPEVLKTHGGYKNYALGKWNLGHHSPDYLPTARGFDYYLGYLTTENTYWTKSMAEFPGIKDFMEATTEEYHAYSGSDMGNYSTFLYRDHAVSLIEAHDFTAQPMFMYLALQAAHPPFEDLTTFTSGLTEDYFSAEQWATVQAFTPGHHRQQYILSIILLDAAVESIVNALTAAGQMDNTYLIFASDNGGCPSDGGNNGALRGTKGTLFEGGTKVDAFLYHSSFKSNNQNSVYSGLMHVSDWFPSMLYLAGITSYRPSISRQVEGYNHGYAWFNDQQQTPRGYLLYNYYHKAANIAFDKDVNGSVAVRDRQYKLIHTFIDNSLSKYYSFNDPIDENDDHSVTGPKCTEENMMKDGTFEHMLFDLIADPNETTNLYNDPAYSKAQVCSFSLSFIYYCY